MDLLQMFCFPGGSEGKASACNAGDPGSIPGSGRSPGEGNGNPLQYSWPGESHGWRSLVGYSPQGHRVGHDWMTSLPPPFRYSLFSIFTWFFFFLASMSLLKFLLPSPIYSYRFFVVVVQSTTVGCIRLFATLWTVAHQASLSFTISQSFL